jgi:hypothetical protein
MHVTQMLVECLESTMDHSLPQVELRSICKMSYNKHKWAQTELISVDMESFE